MTRILCEYGTFLVALESETGCNIPTTFNGNVLVAVTLAASVTVTVTLKVPVAVGTPHSSPSPSARKVPPLGPADTNEFPAPEPVRMDTPGGRPVAVQVKGAVPPPRTAIPRLHVTPSVQSSKF